MTFFPVGEEIFPYVEEYLGVLFKSEQLVGGWALAQRRGVQGTPHRWEAPGKTQDTLEGPCLSSGLGTSRGELYEVAGEREVWAGMDGKG